ncbi:MAG: prepilin-type N-terminal cleavage/methylation domain-containing protein [Saccharofermentans sp.]|nr:prepilin-type N-terminal cleavage/methylation domain-containing protein [Saccharofermentans sp.]
MKKFTKSKAGFSLIEIIMVVAIIVILAGVMALNISSYISKANSASALEESIRSSNEGLVQSYEDHMAELGFDRVEAEETEAGSSSASPVEGA